jgi:hypothetical protein
MTIHHVTRKSAAPLEHGMYGNALPWLQCLNGVSAG